MQAQVQLGPSSYDPTSLTNDQQAVASGAPLANREQRIQDAARAEAEKNQQIAMMAALHGGSSGRGVPFQNMHMANGREGLVNPQLTGQQTFKPLPFDSRYASIASLQSLQQSNRLFQPGEVITSQVQQMTPQQQLAFRQPNTVYQQVPNDWMQNRLNLALQRKRETSIYAIK